MLLKRIELQGFKSFADKTILSFGDGTTAVVGPNGSGKSNISDAIRWVIGEMSAKSLRGANMQDVIFAGTELRKPVNFAEVSLVLDNSSHIFNIDFDEVVVTRRLFRSGESVYQINKANCRLKDIHELFMDTGLGRDGYSIMSQGNVSQILSTKAEDRRSLFEEAAGVSKYKYRKEESVRKLNSVEENLVRINDIESELESQLQPLKNQSEKARKYLELYSEYKNLDVNLALIILQKNTQDFKEAEKLYKSVEDELSDLKAQESETEFRISQLYDENKTLDSEKTSQNELLINNESQNMSVKNEITVNENNIKNNHNNIKRIENEINSIEIRKQNLQNEIKNLELSISKKQLESENIVKRFENVKQESEKIAQEQQQLQQNIDYKRSEAISVLNEISSKKAKIDGMETLRKNFIERKNVVLDALKSFNLDRENTQREIEKLNNDIKEKQLKHKKLRDTVDKYHQKLDSEEKILSNLISKSNELEVEYNSKFSKKRILEDMENDYAGYSKSVKAVLKAEELKKYCIYGTISGLIDVNKEYVIAIETALGGAMQNIIVESEEDAKAAIDFLRQSKEGRATFLPISSVHGRVLDNISKISSAEGYIGIASDLVKCDKKYDGIIKSLLGRTVVVSNIDNAIALSRQFGYKFRTVTLEGDVLNAGGSISGGSVNKQSGFLSRAAQIKELKKELTYVNNQINEIRSQKEKSLAHRDTLNISLESYMGVLRQCEEEIIRLDNTLNHLSQSFETGQQTEEGYKLELNQIESQLSASSEEIASLLSQMRELEHKSDKMQTEIEDLDKQYQIIANMKDEKSQNIMDDTLELANIQKDIELFNNKINSSNSDIKLADKQKTEKLSEIEDLHIENDKLYLSIQEKYKLIDELERLSEEIKKKIIIIDEKKSKIVDTLKNIQTSNKELSDKLFNLQQELSRLETRKVKLNLEKENTVNRLWDEYELTVSAAEEIKTEIENPKESFKRLAELKSSIRGLGSVNIDSIEEYKNVENRYEFLSKQKSDLEDSKSNLLQIIDSMEELMEEHFEEQFESINKSFSEVFTELFGGGKGRLYLSDPDNMLESGIEIEVQLPGKGLQNINLYSGGEKSFIAIALLFAILKVRPTPFCILDEIDAALDDVNVSRFATYLRNYTDQTQFIIITHRRGSMEAANILYGVTMQEKGVSKLLSLHIDDVDEDLVQ